MKILLVDDAKDLSLIIKIALERKGHQVMLDPNALILSKLNYDFPDLILLDINLENLDGGDLCSKLRNDPRTKNIPIILISGIMDLRQIAQMVGAQGYLVKPFGIEDLEEVIAKI